MGASASRAAAPGPERVLAGQLDALRLDRDRPLLISDADEVLLRFVAALERFIAGRGLYLELASFALTGNIRSHATGAPLPRGEVRTLIADFFDACTEDVEPVPGAAAALRALARRAQVVVLSNVPPARREARARGLRRHGMPYPVIANAGDKGAAVASLAASVRAPVFFLDDLPHNHEAVAERAAEVVRVHFIADPRLARLLGPAAHCHARYDDWPSARAFIEARLDALGY